MSKVEKLAEQLQQKFNSAIEEVTVANKEVTIEVNRAKLKSICKTLRDDKAFAFDVCIDVCGVDYLHYGVAEWATGSTTETGFSRAAERDTDREVVSEWNKPRFAVVYHLLSTTNNQRLRVRVFAEGETPCVDSVVDIWKAADWFEREAFDLYGILFNGHPDLRRILTDYGFIGHPFRKDFPVSGHVEVRYDAKKGRVVYEPVEIEPRILVPKVIREDNRYTSEEKSNG